jgi:hypothetical protein
MKNSLLAGVLVGVLGGIVVPTGAVVSPENTLDQGVTAQAGVPTGDVALGTVRISRPVLADGKPLAPGTYQIRVTAQRAMPEAAGQLPELNRWAEFLQGGNVKGREVLTIVPGNEVRQIAKGPPPPPGAAKVEMLRGNEYLRIWIASGGTHYLIHLPLA